MMIHQFKRLAFFIVLFTIELFAWGESSDNNIMNTLTKDKGLAGESVTCIMTDHIGQIWIGTSNGVNRFNGKKLDSFVIPRTNHKPVNVFDICEGTDKSMYIATNLGLYVLRYGHSEFNVFLPDVRKADCMLFWHNKLFFGNRSGLNIYDGKKIDNITVGTSRISLDNSVRDIVFNQGKIWFVSKYALNCYDPRYKKVKSYMLTRQMPERTAFCQLAIWHTKIYLGTKNNGLWVWDSRDKQLRAIPGIGNIVTRMSISGDGKLSVANDGGGAFLIDCRNDKIMEHYCMDGDSAHRLPTDAVYCYYRDRNHVNWFGFYRQGMLYTYHSESLFKIYSFGKFTTEGLDVLSLCIKNKKIVIGTNEGVFFIDEEENKVKHISSEELGGVHLISKIIYYQGNFYIGSYDGGVRKFNPKTYSVSRISKFPLLAKTSIGAMVVSPSQELWLSTTEGIYVLDQHGKWVRYTESNSKIYGGIMNSILFDKNGQAWINSSFGMMLYSPVNRQFEYAGFPQGFFNKEAALTGKYGHNGCLYFNNRSGVWYTDLEMKKFGQLQLPSGLLDEGCYAFMDDFQGSYWIVTDKGLFRMDYALDNLQHFGYGEGLKSLLVNAVLLSPDGDGKVWIATSNGLLSVDHNALMHWQKSTCYSVLLYRIRKGGELLNGTEESSVNEMRYISLNWNLTSVSLSVAPVVDDYACQDGRLYQYKLDDAKVWTFSRDGEDILIRHLAPGTHLLTIRLAGAPGTTRIYKIMVRPSWLFFVELLFICGTVILFVFWLRYRRNTNIFLNERNEIEDALVEVEQERQQKDGVLDQHDTPKYDRVHLDQNECEQIVSRMKNYIEKTKAYTNSDLKMSDLAEYLHLSSSRLSQVFSLYLKENYYEFINQYRLEEFKRLVVTSECRKYTLTALSEKCGFKKSSFFSTFRKEENMTPAEYLKRHNIKF
jgi:AraC-like DNA-binding protein/streptogramin lyase